MARQKDKAREEARHYVGSGKLRDALKRGGYSISEEAIDKIVDACCFALHV